MGNILVLGSSGQIGHTFCDYLSENGHKLLEFDILKNDSEDLRTPHNHILDQYLKMSDFVYFLAFDVQYKPRPAAEILSRSRGRSRNC